MNMKCAQNTREVIWGKNCILFNTSEFSKGFHITVHCLHNIDLHLTYHFCSCVIHRCKIQVKWEPLSTWLFWIHITVHVCYCNYEQYSFWSISDVILKEKWSRWGEERSSSPKIVIFHYLSKMVATEQESECLVCLCFTKWRNIHVPIGLEPWSLKKK